MAQIILLIKIMIGFIFGIQSKSDVITNSSSELFVFKNQETAGEVVNLLDTIYPKWRSEYMEPLEASELDNDNLLWLIETFTPYRFWSVDRYSINPEVFKMGKRNRTLRECELPKFLGLTEEETYSNWETWNPCENVWENRYLHLSNQCYSKFKEWCIKNHIISLFSIDENPEWEKQEILMNYATRIHMG